MGHASDVCGKRFVRGCMRRGSEWWNEGVKMKVEEKRGHLRNGCSVTVWRNMKDIGEKCGNQVEGGGREEDVKF